jgi:hypothetical protein
MIAHNPLLRSGRVALPHPAPTLGKDAQTHEGIIGKQACSFRQSFIKTACWACSGK